jgi:hypothetical protein
MQDCKSVPTPAEGRKDNDHLDLVPFQDPSLYRQAIGSLMYLMCCTRPDLAYSVNTAAREMSSPTQASWMRVKRIFRYLKGTSNAKLIYYAKKDPSITCYSDSSYADEIDKKSTGGYVFIKNGAAISWSSKKQSVTAQSSTEAEYIALAEATKQALWYQKLL